MFNEKAFEKGRACRENFNKNVKKHFPPFLFGAILGSFFVYALISYPIKSSGDFSSWVQAIGSISAIFFAIHIGINQNKNNLKILYEGKKIDKNNENRIVIMEVYSVALLLEKMGKTITSFMKNMEEKVDFISLKEIEKEYKYEDNKITCFNIVFNLEGKKTINIGHFFSDLIETHNHHKKRIKSYIDYASSVDVTNYPKMFVSNELSLSSQECQDFIDLVDDFIKYSDSIKEETNANKVMPHVFTMLEDILDINNRISDYQQSILETRDGLSASLEKDINSPYWNRYE